MCQGERLFREGKLPRRICHCDTKVNNMMFDRETGKFLLVIDLDTVMPSLFFSDYGDFLRSAANAAAEASPYYNIECNCAGTLLIAAGEDRHDRRPAPAEVLAGVDRWSSLGRKAIPLTEGPAQWHMALVVPVGTFFESGLTDLTGLRMRGNAYKCGDCLKEPHFLSLFPIATERPDFHRPEFFRDIVFAG